LQEAIELTASGKRVVKVAIIQAWITFGKIKNRKFQRDKSTAPG